MDQIQRQCRYGHYARYVRCGHYGRCARYDPKVTFAPPIEPHETKGANFVPVQQRQNPVGQTFDAEFTGVAASPARFTKLARSINWANLSPSDVGAQRRPGTA